MKTISDIATILMNARHTTGIVSTHYLWCYDYIT